MVQALIPIMHFGKVLPAAPAALPWAVGRQPVLAEGAPHPGVATAGQMGHTFYHWSGLQPGPWGHLRGASS